MLKLFFIKLIRIYQIFISPILPNTCRFHPTCSSYAIKALQRWGVIHGLWLTLKRLARCHPWSKGGYDDVPEEKGFEK